MAADDPRLRRINFDIPNEQLAAWLKGPECKAKVAEVTAQILSVYVSLLPEITGNLKAGADMSLEMGGWEGEQDRWFGYVTNHALSYRRTRGRPYPRYIEYGKPTRGIPGGHHLQRAAEIVAGHIGTSGGVSVPGVRRTPHGLRSERTGRFVANPLNARRRRRT